MKSFKVLFLMVLAIPAMARQTDTLSASVLDSSARPIAGATVYVLNAGRSQPSILIHCFGYSKNDCR